MSDNYAESAIQGTKWKRACRVVVDNPYGATPSLMIVEEEAVNLGDRVITNICANLSTQFDPENPLHLDLYTKLNEVYTILRDIRDTPVEVQE